MDILWGAEHPINSLYRDHDPNIIPICTILKNQNDRLGHGVPGALKINGTTAHGNLEIQIHARNDHKGGQVTENIDVGRGCIKNVKNPTL